MSGRISEQQFYECKIKIAFCILIKVLIAQHIYVEKEAETVSFDSV